MTDRKFRLARIWSNEELRRFASMFSGSVVNASAWRDEDKQGRRYKDYFTAADEYHISNYISEARGFQGDLPNEFFMDLAKPLPKEHRRFDTVFNHTVLEHVFEVDQAFSNLCSLSNDIVIVVVPFLQEEHSGYGDYWRFAPQSLDKLFSKNGMELLYLSYNEHPNASVYIFAIGSKRPDRWAAIKTAAGNRAGRLNDTTDQCGTQIVVNHIPLLKRVKRRISAFLRR